MLLKNHHFLRYEYYHTMPNVWFVWFWTRSENMNTVNIIIYASSFFFFISEGICIILLSSISITIFFLLLLTNAILLLLSPNKLLIKLEKERGIYHGQEIAFVILLSSIILLRTSQYFSIMVDEVSWTRFFLCMGRKKIRIEESWTWYPSGT